MGKEINEVPIELYATRNGEFIKYVKYEDYNDALIYIKKLQEENNLLKAKIKCMEEITGHKQKQPKDESEIYNEMFR